MRSIWLGLAVVLWLGACAVGAENTTDTAGAATAADKESAPNSTTPAEGARAKAPAAGGQVAVVPAGGSEHTYTRVVLRLKSVPASDLAKTIFELLRSEGRAVPTDSARSVVIVPSAASNSLVIGGSPEAVSEVRKLVEELDRPAPMVRLEVVIGEVPLAKAGQGPAKGNAPSPEEIRQQMETLAQVQLTTLDNQVAEIQLGRKEARITATQTTQHGRVNSVTYENVGTMMTLTPRVSPDGTVVMELNIEDSRLGPAAEGAVIDVPNEGEPIRAGNTDLLRVRTSLRIPDGQTVAVGGTRQAKSGKQQWVLITPHTISPGGVTK